MGYIHTPEETDGGVHRHCDYCGEKRVITVILVKTDTPDIAYCCNQCEIEAQSYRRLAYRFPREFAGYIPPAQLDMKGSLHNGDRCSYCGKARQIVYRFQKTGELLEAFACSACKEAGKTSERRRRSLLPRW